MGVTDPDPIAVTDEIVTLICAELGCDARSVLRRLAGLPVRGAAQSAIDAALERHGVRPVKGAK
jgi:hypothetical protein